MTSAMLKKELETVEKEHEEDIKRLHDRHAAIYLDEMEMAYASNDPALDDEELEKNTMVSPFYFCLITKSLLKQFG